MKIGLLTSFYPDMLGGAETSLEALLQGYQRAGRAYVLFTLNGAKEPKNAELVSVPVLRRVPRKLKIAGLPVLDDILGRQLPPLMRRHGVDLLHVLDTYSLCGGVKAASMAHLPTVFTCQNNVGTPYESFGARFPISRWLSAREKQIIRAIGECARTIAVSNFIAWQLASAGISPSRITTIYTAGAITEWPTGVPTKAHLPLRILALGRHQYHKGFQVLLLSAAQLIKEGYEIDVVITGRGPYSRRLHRLARELKLGARVRFVGLLPRDGLASFLDWSDVVVVPTLTPEPFGRVAIEAMSRGKPLIGTRVGGIPEIVTDDVTGWLVSPDRPGELTHRLRMLADHPNLVEKMGRNALFECRQRFSSETIVRQIIDVYDAVEDSKSRASSQQRMQRTEGATA